MKKFLLLSLLMLTASIAYSYEPPDSSCLKTFYLPEDSTFTNPYDVRVDSCEDSPTYEEFYGKDFFSASFNYNIIPRDGVFPADTIVEYHISDIDTIYSQAISDFQALEAEFGTFRFREMVPDFPDTTPLITRNLFINFDNYVNIDTVVKRLRQFDCIESIGFVGWFAVISDVETQEPKHLIEYNSISQILTVRAEANVRENYLQVYNLNGMSVLQVRITQANQLIDLGSLAKGFYFVRLGSAVQKIIVND